MPSTPIIPAIPTPTPPPLGLIAGRGQLPILQARGMRAAGRRVVCVGLAGQYDPQLPSECDDFHAAGIVRLGRWIRLLRREGVSQAVMVGQVRKARIYQPLRLFRQLPDLRAAKLWYRVLKQDRRDQTLLAAVADELAGSGIELLDTTRYIPDHLADAGVMTRRQPSARQRADIDFALPLLLGLSALDVGQAVAVKDGDVIAVEAIEGTDAMIQRAGSLCPSGGWTLCKGPHREKDKRFDVPTVGVATIQQMKAAGASCLMLIAGQTILIDKPAVLAAADAAGIAVVGVATT